MCQTHVALIYMICNATHFTGFCMSVLLALYSYVVNAVCTGAFGVNFEKILCFVIMISLLSFNIVLSVVLYNSGRKAYASSSE